MPRKNRKKRAAQRPRGHKAPRSVGRNYKTPQLKRQQEFLERTWQPPEQEAA